MLKPWDTMRRFRAWFFLDRVEINDFSVVEKASYQLDLPNSWAPFPWPDIVVSGLVGHTQLSQKLGGDKIDFWIPPGWGAAAAVGFSIAGRLPDFTVVDM